MYAVNKVGSCAPIDLAACLVQLLQVQSASNHLIRSQRPCRGHFGWLFIDTPY